ncbi:hypothetical protein PG993_009249 [Apiospora rasikravindrae]|uniref:Uncharacterized protein n=1 Tax=Apiospora rasikravindrae TaxID=990691 RepID=A0ABR1SIZ6_9PEZI
MPTYCYDRIAGGNIVGSVQVSHHSRNEVTLKEGVVWFNIDVNPQQPIDEIGSEPALGAKRMEPRLIQQYSQK